jgi:hypothetical protein
VLFQRVSLRNCWICLGIPGVVCATKESAQSQNDEGGGRLLPKADVALTAPHFKCASLCLKRGAKEPAGDYNAAPHSVTATSPTWSTFVFRILHRYTTILHVSPTSSPSRTPYLENPTSSAVAYLLVGSYGWHTSPSTRRKPVHFAVATRVRGPQSPSRFLASDGQRIEPSPANTLAIVSPSRLLRECPPWSSHPFVPSLQ